MTSPFTELLKSTNLDFTIWHDPIAERNGIPADSDDALVWYTPVIGPSAVLLLHRIARYLSDTPNLTFDTVELAGSIGLAHSDRLATSEGFKRAMQRLEMFGMIRIVGSTIYVRTILPPLAQRHMRLLPTYLRTACPWTVTS